MVNETAPWYTVNDVNQIDSPALLIYLERVKHNIALAIEIAGGVQRLRPHIKTHKSANITYLMLEAGITKFKCATIAEAELLAQCNAPDILLAYQPTGPKIERLLTLLHRYPQCKFSCLVDSIEAAKAIATEAEALHSCVNMFIDVNIGMNRTGIAPAEAVELYKFCALQEGLKVVGLHGYDGHINDTNMALRTEKADEAFRVLSTLQNELKNEGLANAVIVIGGSPTFPIHAKRKGVECSPGTFVYWDKSYSELFPDMNFLPAALVLSRIVSIVNKTTVCLDLGHKAIAAENPLSRRVHWLNATGMTPLAQSEEHLVMESSENHSCKIGDVLYGIPFHICPTCALYDSAFVVENKKVTGEWRTDARARKIAI